MAPESLNEIGEDQTPVRDYGTTGLRDNGTEGGNAETLKTES